MLILGTYVVTAVVPSVLSNTAKLTRFQIIKNYFFCGFSYPDILVLMFVIHDIKLSLRQLGRILKANNLVRRKNKTPKHTSMHVRIQVQGLGFRV